MAQELAKLGHNVVVFTNQMQPRQFLEEEPLFSVVEHKRQRYAFEEFEKHKAAALCDFGMGILETAWLSHGLVWLTQSVIPSMRCISQTLNF